MNKPMLVLSKSWRPLLLGLAIVTGSLVLPLSGVFSQRATAAVTADQCYAFNNSTNPGSNAVVDQPSSGNLNNIGNNAGQIAAQNQINATKVECVNAGYCKTSIAAGPTFACSQEIFAASTTSSAAAAAAAKLAAIEAADTPEKCAAAGGEWINKDCSSGTSKAVCSGQLSWVFCPLTYGATEAMTSLAGGIANYMQFDPLIGSPQGNAILSIWQVVVGIANLFLVIAFLIVIFSQATSIGLSAYGIKKMLPRIIMAAILINLSFSLCALAVDVSNVVGGSIQGIINAASVSITEDKTGLIKPDFGESIAGMGVMLAGATAIAGLTGTLPLVMPILVTGLVSLFFLLAILAIRHLLVVLLIIISPLAFAAMVLPNTEGMFKTWWKMFYTSLALYPIIMALAYGSMLVSKVILIMADTPDGEASILTSIEQVFTVGVAFIMLFAWVWGLKSIVSWGSGAMGKLAGRLNDPSKGLIDRSRKWAGEKKDRSTYQQMRNMRKNAGNTAAQRRAITRLGQGGMRGAVARRGAYGVFGNPDSKLSLKSTKEGNLLLGSQAEKALMGIQKEQRESFEAHMNRPTADLLGRGYRLRHDGSMVKLDSAGKVERTFDKEHLDDAARAAGIRGGRIDTTTLDNMKYMRDNKVMDSLNGVRAVATQAAAKGALDSRMVQEFTDRLGSTADKAEFVDRMNDVAAENGLSHLMFNQLGKDEKTVDFGGRLADATERTTVATPVSITGRVNTLKKAVDKGFGGISKDVFGDSDMEHSAALTGLIEDQARVDAEGFRAQVARMNDEQIEKMTKMFGRARIHGGTFAENSSQHQAFIKAQQQALLTIRGEARKEFNS